MTDVFISYSSKDTASAEYLLNTLESMYISCWIASRDIPKGDNFADLIPSAIKNANIFLILVSQNSQQSVQVHNELNFATHIGLPIIAVLLDSAPLTNAFQYHISQENRFEGKGRLAAVSSELVNWIHTELEKQSRDKQKRQEENDLRKVAPPGLALDRGRLYRHLYLYMLYLSAAAGHRFGLFPEIQFHHPDPRVIGCSPHSDSAFP